MDVNVKQRIRSGFDLGPSLEEVGTVNFALFAPLHSHLSARDFSLNQKPQ